MFDDKLDSPNQPQEDVLPIWLRVVFFLVPPVGLIFYFANFRKSPKNAKLAALISSVGLILNVILSFFVEI